jgi:hypothetical protein
LYKVPELGVWRKWTASKFFCVATPFWELYSPHLFAFALSPFFKTAPFGTELIYQGLTPPTQGTLATSKSGTLPISPCISITYKIHKVPFFPKTPKITLPKKELYQLAYSYRPISVLTLSTTRFLPLFPTSRNVSHNN